MKINTRIRILAVNQIIDRLEKHQKSLSPYGYEDPMITYYKIDYWENVLELLNNKPSDK